MNRRSFLQVSASAAAGLLVGFYLPERSKLAAQCRPRNCAKLNAWIHIAPDDSVTFRIHKVEMGQGTVTSLSQLLAEELECDWGKFRTEFPPVERVSDFRAWSAARASALPGTLCAKRAQLPARCWFRRRRKRGASTNRHCRAESGFVINTSTNAQAELRKTGRRGGEAPGAHQCGAEGSEAVQAYRQIHEAARHAE